MGLLADIFSYGDGLKRKVNGLLQDPAGTVNLGAQRFAEDQNSLLALMDQAGYTPGSKSVLQTPQGQQQARNSLADKAMQTYGGLLGATVWHGSPHKFDKFDSSKIGTGEGAQAYGHGLYLAESPDVARIYSADRAYVGASMAGKPLPINYDDPAWIAKKTMDELGDAVKAKAHLEMVQRTAGKYQPSETKAAVQGAIDMIAAGKVGTKGSLYKVDLPDELIAKMLDWDKPMSQQSPEVRAAFESRVAPLREQYAKPAPGWGDLGGAQSYDPTGRELLELLRKRDATTAQDFLGNGLGRDVSEQLRSQGIPGIRYLDGGSRGAGTGTSNYVVFPGNESLLQILERNGQPIK